MALVPTSKYLWLWCPVSTFPQPRELVLRHARACTSCTQTDTHACLRVNTLYLFLWLWSTHTHTRRASTDMVHRALVLSVVSVSSGRFLIGVSVLLSALVGFLHHLQHPVHPYVPFFSSSDRGPLDTEIFLVGSSFSAIFCSKKS